jgi:transcription elongation factor Elf1
MKSDFDSNKGKTDLIHLHTCIHCGQMRYREDIGDHEINSGLIHCPGCGMDGPLNVEIRNLPDKV